jgi:hypothetical protein
MEAAHPTPFVRHAGVIAACFALGVLGALGIATQVGACGKTWP